MADTLNFGPEWLRALSDGNNVGTPPPSPGIPGKYKLADYRYGREEMLALNNPNTTEPSEELRKLTTIFVEKAQEPISMQSLTEEEQRLMSQSVNSTAVLRMFGRGGPPGVRGGRGGIERGRGRGRGRGEGYLQRGLSAEEGGGFGRPPSHSRSDGWEEVGAKRNYQSRYEDGSSGPPQRQFQRSLSNENWRDRGGDEEEEDGDWRKAGGSKWNTRGSWREPINRIDRSGFDSERHQPNGIQRGGFDRDKGRSYQRNRISESWEEEDNLPEWSMPDTEGNDVGTFDSSGAFVSTKKKPDDKRTENNNEDPPPTNEKIDSDTNKSPAKQKVDTKVKVENKEKAKTPPPQVKQEGKQNETGKKNEHVTNKKPDTNVKIVTSKPAGFTCKPKEPEIINEMKSSREINSAQNNSNKSDTVKVKNEETNDDDKEKVVPTPGVPTPKDSTALPIDHEDAHKWFYKDPQGDMQGPFTSNEMAEWFSAGYFTMNLQVKRGCDEKISPLGELIKSWGRVPFLPGPAPPPALNTPTSQANSEAAQQEQMKALQQLLMQQQMMQQQFIMRQLQMQQIQQVMQQLQENEQFKSLPPLQQQQLAMQLMMKQSAVSVVPQSQMQKLSPSRSPPTESISGVPPSNPNHPAFHRSVSQPDTSTDEGASIWDTNTNKQNMGGWSQPTSVWDLDPKTTITNTELEMQVEKARKEKDEQLERIRQEKEEEERRIQEELKRHHEEMMKQQEELRRQKEEMERQKLEIEKQRQLELQSLEEVRRKKQEEEERQRKHAEEVERRRKEEEMRKEREMQQKHEEEMRRREDNIRREEEMRQQQRQMMEQQQKQREMEEQQELQRRQQEEMRQQQELHKQHQQQEALKRLQQEQMANMQLPQHAQWANQQQGGASPSEQQKAKSLLEIQEQEERERLREEEIQRQLEVQRQQLMAIQQQQQQQKSWSEQIFSNQPSSRSLIEIQEEQARQLELDRQQKHQEQQSQTKNLSISAASAWSGMTSSSHWASEGAWGNQARNIGSPNGSGSLGFWDDAIISSKRAPAASNKNMQGNPTEFPALKGGNPMNTPSVPVSKTQKPSKMKKEEEAVQRLFKQPKTQENDFSQWCERALKSLDTSVDIPTFVAFLTEVESPYEVHDYVRSYLGESKASKDFAKQFLEKRSQSRNKAKPPVIEESIWGPAPARDYRQSTNQPSDFDSQKNKGGKKKKKMMKIDSSILGFTVSADPERKNVGEMEDDGK